MTGKKIKGPLDGIPKLTPEKVKDLLEEGRKNRLIEEEEKKKPPKTSTGKCVFCECRVEAKHVRESHYGTMGMMIGGPPQVHRWRLLGYNCTGCGLKYEFPPPEFIERDD